MSGQDLSRVVWRKSSRSSSNGGACVEVAVWRKSSRSSSNGGECVEVATTAEPMHLARDSKNPNGPVLAFTSMEWTMFLDQVKKGTLDLS
jgi:hypothetical protein